MPTQLNTTAAPSTLWRLCLIGIMETSRSSISQSKCGSAARLGLERSTAADTEFRRAKSRRFSLRLHWALIWAKKQGAFVVEDVRFWHICGMFGPVAEHRGGPAGSATGVGKRSPTMRPEADQS